MKKDKKVEKKSTNKPKKKIKRAFTLLELLAVIIILGILILIAIPSVTKYISDSRKETYIDTARQYLKGAVNLINSGKLDVYDTNVTYYIPSGCIKLESGGESPYGGKFNPAYVVVIYDNESFKYLWMSRDNQGIGIKSPTLDKDLDTKLIKTGLKESELAPVIGIDGREYVAVLDENDCTTEGIAVTNAEIYGSSDGNTTPAEATENDVYYNVSLNKYYQTLERAINAASSNQKLELIKDTEEVTPVVIPSTLKNFTIDFKQYGIYFSYKIEKPLTNNGQVIFTNTSSAVNDNGSLSIWSPVINNGTIDIRGNMYLRSENEAIDNNGTVNIVGGQITGYDADGINNKGTVNMSGGYIGAYTRAIENYNILNVSGGTISGTVGIYNAQNATTTFGGNAIIRANGTGIGNSGVLNYTGGKIVIKYPYATYGINNSGTANITNANIHVTTNGGGHTAYAIKHNSGILTINSGTILADTESSGYAAYAIHSSATMVINGGEITAHTHKSYGLDATAIYVNNSSCTIKSGAVSGDGYGIDARGAYTLTLGTNDSTVNNTNPEIKGTSINGIGIKLTESGTFNFYDGIVTGRRAANKSIDGNAAHMNYPNGYRLVKDYANGVDTAHLTK